MLLDPSNTYFINNYIMIIITLTLSGRSVHVIEMSFFQGAKFFLRKVCFYRKIMGKKNMRLSDACVGAILSV